MPDSAHTLQLYALALALVPDESDAGDLFMAARDEAHLRRLAAGWRQRHGLPPLADSPPPVALSEEQREYGLHLVRRRDRRRKSRLVLAAVTVVLVLAGVRMLSQVPRPGASLAAEQAKAKPSATFGVQVLRAEATPGAITVWWSYAGDRADEAEPPRLVLGDSTFDAVSVESRRQSDGLIEGSTTYQVITAGHKSARLEARMRGTYEPLGAADSFDLTRVSDPSARVISGETQLFDFRRAPVGTITQVMVGTNYTLFRYRPTGALANAETLEVQAGSALLSPYGELAPMQYLTDGQELVFGPVPPDAESIEVKANGSRTGFSVVMDLNPDTDLVQRNGDETLVTIQMVQDMEAPWRDALLTTGLEAYRADIKEIGRSGRMVRYLLRSSQVPPGRGVTGVQLYADRMFPGPPVSIDLS